MQDYNVGQRLVMFIPLLALLGILVAATIKFLADQQEARKVGLAAEKEINKLSFMALEI